MMGWTPIARTEVVVMRDSRLTRWLVYLLVGICLVGGYVFPVVTGGPVTTDRFAGFIVDAIGLVVPLVGLLFGYNAIVGERASGRLALLLSLPHDRRDVLVAKLAGRGGLLALAIVLGLAAAGALVLYPFGSIAFGSYAAFVLTTVLFGATYFGIGLAISTYTRSKQRATIAAFSVFFLFVVVWDAIGDALAFGLDRLGVTNGELPSWALFVHGAEPGSLYDRVVDGFIVGEASGPYLDPAAPWYLGEWVALGAVLAWAVVPILVGYRRFERTDL